MGVEIIVMAAIALIGGGISYSASVSSANQASEAAGMNAAAGLEQARQAGSQARMQGQLQDAHGQKEAEAAANNAQAVRDRAEAQTRISQENIRRTRNKFAEDMARVRASMGNSGVVDSTGSPLEMFVQAAEDQALQETEQRWSDENDRRKSFFQADVEERQGKVLGINANLSVLSARTQENQARMQATQVRLDEFSAKAEARGMRRVATGQLISSIGQTAAGGYSSYQNRMRSPNFTTQTQY